MKFISIYIEGIPFRLSTTTFLKILKILMGLPLFEDRQIILFLEMVLGIENGDDLR